MNCELLHAKARKRAMTMAFDSLTRDERELAIRAVWLVATTDVIGDDEIQTVTGFDRHELAKIHGRLAIASGEPDEDALRAVGQCLNNLCGYPHGQRDFVEQQLGCSMDELSKLKTKWFGAGKYFDRLL